MTSVISIASLFVSAIGAPFIRLLDISTLTLSPTPYSVINLIAGILFLSFTVILLSGNNKLSTRMYAGISGALMVWAFSMGLYYMIENHELLLFLNRLNHFAGAAVGILFFYFSLLYPKETPPARWIGRTLVTLEIALAYLYLGTDLIIKDTFILLGNNIDSGWLFGKLGFIFHLSLLVPFTAGLFILYRKYLAANEPEEKSQLRAITGATLLGSLLAMTVVVVLPVFGLFRFSWLGPLFSLSWVALTTYVIITYHTLNIRLILAEIALLGMGILLFFNIFVGFPLIPPGISFPFVFTLPTGYTLINWFTAGILVTFGFFIYLGNKSRIARSYATIVWTAALWAVGVGLYYLAADDVTANFIIRGNHLVGGLIAVIFYYYTLMMPEGKFPKPLVTAGIIASQVILGYLLFFTQLIIVDAHIAVATLDRTWIYGGWSWIATGSFFIFFITASYNLNAKLPLIIGPDPKLRRAILWSTLIGALPGLLIIYGLIEAGGNTTSYWFAPTGLLAWIALAFYMMKRYSFLSVKFITAELFTSILILILFINIFVSGSGSFFIPLSLSASLNPYSIANWLTAFLLLLFSGFVYTITETTATKLHSLIIVTTSLWALTVGVLYSVTDAASFDFLVRLSIYCGNLISVVFFAFALISVGKKRFVQAAAITILPLEALLCYLYFKTPFIIATTSIGTSEVLSRSWLFGSLGFLSRIHFLVFLGIGFVYLYRNIDLATSLGVPENRKTVFWTSCIGTIPVILITYLSYFGYTATYWLGPIAMIGWIATTYYVITRKSAVGLKVVASEMSIFFVVFLLFGNIFSQSSLTSSVISKSLVFIAFTSVGGVFVKNIIKSEEQKEELDRLSITLSDLNKNLKTKVRERTRELEQSKNHIETVLENLTNGLLEYSPDGTLVRINKAAEKMLDVKRGTVLGKSVGVGDVRTQSLEALTLITYPELSGHRGMPTALPIDNKSVDTREVTVLHPQEREFQVTVAPVEQNGVNQGTVRIIRDVTRENLISRGKSEFISIAAHQLRSPLALIRWTTSALLSGDFGDLSTQIRESLAEGEGATKRMGTLVGDLLTVARIEGGKFDYSLKETDIGELVARHVESRTQSAESHQITLSLEAPASKRILVLCDAEKIGIVLDNILDNAITYTPPGGSVKISLVGGSDATRITIKDSGVGIPLAQKERLGTKFFRTDAALRANPNGSGLGLFIAQNIISYHKGTITFSSIEKKGTTITITLPRI